MGGCLSRKKNGPSSSSLNVAHTHVSIAAKEALGDAAEAVKIKKKVVEEEEKVKVEDEGIVKKEIFVIKHRKSHDREKPSIPCQKDVPVDTVAEDNCSSAVEINNSLAVRTSSCTKEEVDAILIQCGRLSRSNSSGKVASSGRKYSGSKRSFDLDQDQDLEDVNANSNQKNNDDDDCEILERRQHRQRHRQSGARPSSPSSQGRRRTPSRERDQRSGSRERGSSGSGRRVSRSPGRRSETANSNNSSTTNRPGKMVSVPATVSSLTMDKSNKNGVETQTAIKRISVKRNVGDAGARTAASPRSQSPARTNGRGSNENNQQQQQQPSLSRSSSRKAEHSPYRRNPLSEIDPNSIVYPQPTGNNKNSRAQTRNKEMEGQLVEKESINQKTNGQGTNCKVISNFVNEPQGVVEEAKPQTLARSRSARRSRDLDFNPETLLNPTAPSYTALLLEDIQNFHQKSTTTTVPSFKVPACVTKACSILEAVADLNSTTGSEDKRSSNLLIGKKLTEAKDPFLESEVKVSDDLMEPSLHKYVTVRRGGTSAAEDMDGQESSGSNSFVGGSNGNGGSQQHWGYYSGSSWEPNSAESTDRWTTRSNDEESARRGFSGQRSGIGRGRAGSSKPIHSAPIVAST